jgi:hypothetical protein
MSKCINCKFCINRKHEVDARRVNVCVKNGVKILSENSGCPEFKNK